MGYASVTTLLYGFFQFYAHEFPSHLYMISIKRGGSGSGSGCGRNNSGYSVDGHGQHGHGHGPRHNKQRKELRQQQQRNSHLFPKTMFLENNQSTSLSFCIEDPFETYDSHFPHDLASPTDEKGSIFMARCFQQSATYLRTLLFVVDDNNNHNDNANANANDGKPGFELLNIDDIDDQLVWPEVKIQEDDGSSNGRG